MLEIEHPLTGDKIQVAKQDFIKELNWEAAKIACSELGNGWRLPTIDELKAIHTQLYLQGKGDFGSSDAYWSSTQGSDSLEEDEDENEDSFFIVIFRKGNKILDGKIQSRLKSNLKNVRAVRNL